MRTLRFNNRTRKKIIRLIVVVFISLQFYALSFSQTSTAPIGSGTYTDPYQISSLNNLYWLTQTTSAWTSGKYFIQTNDIDGQSTSGWASGAGLSPIGNSTTKFYGNYNGNNYKISKIYINRTGDCIGLFGYTQSDTVKNLTLEDCTITPSSITGANGVGILAGGGYLTVFYNITINNGSINGAGSYGYMGAVMGRCQNCKFTNCKTSASVSWSGSSNCEVGGFIGYCQDNNVTFCSSTGSVSTPNDQSRTGGFAGTIYGTSTTMSSCYASGTVSAKGGAGGFVGNIYSVTVSDCYATGNVSISSSEAGGFFAFSQSGSNFVRCYCKGTITGSSWAGGFGGYCESPAVTNCFWDTQTSGKSSAMGYLSGTYGGGGTITGKITTDMKTQSTYTGYDFVNVWNIDANYNLGYPILRGINYNPDPNNWTGTVSTDWNTAGNWSKGVVPTSNDDATIPNVTNKPIISNGNTGTARNISIQSSSSVTINGTLQIAGSVTNNGTLTSSSGTVSFIGTSSQSTSGMTGTINTLTVNNTNGVTLSNSITVTNTLNLTGGKLLLGANTLTLDINATISGTPSSSNMIVTNGSGVLKKMISANKSAFNFTFPIGDNTGTPEYSPVTLNFTSGNFSSAYVTVKVTNSKHPNNTSSTDYLNRYWDITQNGITSFACDATFNYLPADVNGTESNIYGGVYNSSWVILNQANTSGHYISGTVTSFASFTGGQISVMPIKLESFNSSFKNRDVTLNWITSTEINNRGFEIFRKSVSGDWTSIGFITGKGQENSMTSYSFNDNKLNSGKYTYRLKQIDFNGNYTYYNLNSIIEVGVPDKFIVSQNYPNPFNPSTKIDYAIPFDGKVNLVIYDMTGREVKRVFSENITAGYYTSEINIGSLASGVYIYKLTAEGNSQKQTMTKKMAIIK